MNAVSATAALIARAFQRNTGSPPRGDGRRDVCATQYRNGSAHRPPPFRGERMLSYVCALSPSVRWRRPSRSLRSRRRLSAPLRFGARAVSAVRRLHLGRARERGAAPSRPSHLGAGPCHPFRDTHSRICRICKPGRTELLALPAHASIRCRHRPWDRCADGPWSVLADDDGLGAEAAARTFGGPSDLPFVAKRVHDPADSPAVLLAHRRRLCCARGN